MQVFFTQVKIIAQNPIFLAAITSWLLSQFIKKYIVFCGFSIFSAMIVIRDAMGVRRSSGLQAKMLNEVGAKMAETMDIPFKPVKEVQGHTPVEVFAGMILGVVIGSYFSLYYTV